MSKKLEVVKSLIYLLELGYIEFNVSLLTIEDKLGELLKDE